MNEMTPLVSEILVCAPVSSKICGTPQILLDIALLTECPVVRGLMFAINMSPLRGFGKLLQGYLEESNVEIVQEMVGLIVAQRAFEINSRAVRTAESMLEIASSLKR